MIKIFKTYFPMILSVIFLGMYVFMFSLLINELGDYFNDATFLVISFLIIVVSFLIEWFYFMIQSATSKTLKDKALWVFLIYLFNVFIIPYYNFKHVVNIKKLKTNMVIYIVLAIVSIVIGILAPLSIEVPEKIVKIHSKDEIAEFIFPGDYVERTTTYDAYASNYTKGMHFGAFIYNTIEDDVDAEYLLESRINWLKTTRQNVNLIENRNYTIDEKSIYTSTYYGEYENAISIYKISAIVFKDTNYIIETIQTAPYSDYEENKEEMEKILMDIKLLKGNKIY